MPQLNEYRTPSPRAILLMRITSVLTSFFFALVPAGVVCIYVWDFIGTLALLIPGIVLVLAVVYVLLAPPIRFRRYRYMIAGDRIELDLSL